MEKDFELEYAHKEFHTRTLSMTVLNVKNFAQYPTKVEQFRIKFELKYYLF